MGVGKLYIVAGPIGNMGDISFRALETLKTVDLILSEDTRETDKLLKQYSIQKSQISYRDQIHEQILPRILETVRSGQSVALISDSGTPLISDPGFKLVKGLKDANIEVVPVPGPSAAIAALSASGLPSDKFIFLGFLQKTKNHRITTLKKYGVLDATLTIYESPYRVKRLLLEIFEALGDRKVCLAKDLTKMHENISTDYVSNLIKNADTIKEKGEYVVLIAKEGF